MKKSFYLLLFALVCVVSARAQVALDATNFPDPIFRTYLADSVDTDKDGVLSQAECDAVINFGGVSTVYSDIFTYNGTAGGKAPFWYDTPGDATNRITSLKGIEHFKKLRILNLRRALVTDLDLSANTALVQMFFGQDTLLQNITFPPVSDESYTKVTSQNPDVSIFVGGCTALKKLDLSPILRRVMLMTGVSSVSATAATSMYAACVNCETVILPRFMYDANKNKWGFTTTNRTLSFSGWSKLKTLDTSLTNWMAPTNSNVFTLISVLDVSGTAIEKLDLSGNNRFLSNLATIWAGKNTALDTVDVRGCTNLTNLQLCNTVATSPAASATTSYSSCNVRHIDLTGLTKLTTLNLVGKSTRERDLAKLDLSTNIALKTCSLHYRGLRELDIANCTALTYVKMDANHLICPKLPETTTLTTVSLGGSNTATWAKPGTCQTDEVYVYDIDGQAGIKVPDNFSFAALAAVGIGEEGYTKSSKYNDKKLVEVDGQKYLIIADDYEVGGEFAEPVTVCYYYKMPWTSGTTAKTSNLYVLLRAQDAPEEEEPTTVDVVTNEQGKAADGKCYASLYYGDKALTVPAGVTAYTYKVADGELTVSKTYAAGEVIPAGQAVIVASDASATHAFSVASTAGTRDESSMLLGTDAQQTINESGYVYYMLSTPPADSDFDIGFWWQTEGGVSITNGAHKAYLKVPADQAAGIKGFSFTGETTGIKTVDELTSRQVNEFWYTLDGQKLNAQPTQKGIYIKGDKKIVIN